MVIEHAPTVTVQPVKEESIQDSPYFSLRWEKPLRGVDDLSFPVGSLHSRLPSAYVAALGGDALKIVSFETGEELRSVTLPLEIASIHRGLEGDADFGNFSYSLLGSPDEGVVVVSATLSRLYKDGSGSGFATAIYGCSFDGKVNWCAKVGVTHSMIATSLPSGGDLLLVEDEDGIFLGITPSGHEAFRVRLPRYDGLVLQKTASGKLCLLIIGPSIRCYELNLTKAEQEGTGQPAVRAPKEAEPLRGSENLDVIQSSDELDTGSYVSMWDVMRPQKLPAECEIHKVPLLREKVPILPGQYPVQDVQLASYKRRFPHARRLPYAGCMPPRFPRERFQDILVCPICTIDAPDSALNPLWYDDVKAGTMIMKRWYDGTP